MTDNVIINMIDRFSEDNMKWAVSIENLFKLNNEERKYFIKHYVVSFVICIYILSNAFNNLLSHIIR